MSDLFKRDKMAGRFCEDRGVNGDTRPIVLDAFCSGYSCLERENAELKAKLAEIEEREAACCPEDVSFDELIVALETKNAGLKELVRKMECLAGICKAIAYPRRGTTEEDSDLFDFAGEIGHYYSLQELNEMLEAAKGANE